MNESVASPAWSRRLIALVCVVLGIVLVGSGATPAAAAKKAKKPVVTLTAPSKGEVGRKLTITASVKGGVAGQKVTLQRHDGGIWTSLVSGKLPAKGKKRVLLMITPTASGAQVYRAVLAKRKKAKKAVSKNIGVNVAARPVTPPPAGPQLTLTTSTSTQNEQTTVNFGGALTGYPADTPVTFQYSWGKAPSEPAWQTVTTVPATGSGSSLSYAGSVTVPVLRNAATNGAPRLNLRAKVAATGGRAGLVSPVRAYLIRTRFDGIYTQYKNGEYVTQNTFVVIYSDLWWRMFFGAIEVQGTTDGWDLLDKAGLRFHATYHEPGEVCIPSDPGDPGAEETCQGDDELPWITYVATWSDAATNTYRIEGEAVYKP